MHAHPGFKSASSPRWARYFVAPAAVGASLQEHQTSRPYGGSHRDYSAVAPGHRYEEAILHTNAGKFECVKCMDGRMLHNLFQFEEGPYNCERKLPPAPSILCAIADAIRDLNRHALAEYLQDTPLKVSTFGGNVSVQAHSGSSTIQHEEESHRDNFWRLLMISVTAAKSRELLVWSPTSIRKLTLTAGDAYIACPVFQHCPKFFYQCRPSLQLPYTGAFLFLRKISKP